MLEKPAFMQGVFAFQGAGLGTPVPFQPALTYKVPADKRAQTIYFRAGNSSGELICLVLLRNGSPMRYFPVGARSAIHVSLAVVEDLAPDSEMEVLVAAPAGLSASAVVDVGLLEIA